MTLMWLTVRGSRPLEASSFFADVPLKAEKNTTTMNNTLHTATTIYDT